MNGLVKKLLVPVAVGAISLFSLSCASERWITGPHELQNLSVNVKYSGTAKAMPGITHKVRVDVFKPEEDLLITTDSITTSLESLKSGQICEMGIAPGKYELSVYLDWNDDGIRNSFEPSASLGRIPFEIISQKVNLEVGLRDKSLPSTGGWVEGDAIFEALEGNEGKHNFLLEIIHTSEGVVKEYTGYATGLQLKNGSTYSTRSVFPGGPYFVKAFWDLNHDGIFDALDPQTKSRDFYVSPGLPTVNVDLTF